MILKKIILNTIDSVHTYEYDSAEIFTTKYSSKIKSNSIHVPSSAKIIFQRKADMTVLLVELPIIKVDAMGNVNIYTHTDFKTATLANAKELMQKEDLKLLKAQLSALKHKKAFGATSLEVIKEKEYSSKAELVKFIKKIKDFTEGGGF